MGLDVYVGTLTRYYSGEWQTIIDQMFQPEQQESDNKAFLDDIVQIAVETSEKLTPETRTTGFFNKITEKLFGKLNKHGSVRRPPIQKLDKDSLHQEVLAWRAKLSRRLRRRLSEPLDWQEGDDAPYFTDKPAWSCYGDLLLWAAYDENPDLTRPLEHVKDWSQDPAFQRIHSRNQSDSYQHLMCGAELWLPIDFSFIFETKMPAGNSVLAGSTFCLERELRTLNKRTWNANQETLDEWRKEGDAYSESLESGACFAFSIFYDLASKAKENKLVMILDY